jgi:hypothetical protein
MGWLAELFETNRIIVLSVYGQVFFVTGLAVALQSRQRSQLPLARPLAWLAAFGIVHGLMEWGYLFIPIQAGFLPQPIVESLLVLQLLMKPLSFAFLFQFGAELVLATRTRDDLPRVAGQPWLRLVPAASIGLWAVATVGLLPMSAHRSPSATSRRESSSRCPAPSSLPSRCDRRRDSSDRS